MDAWQCKWFALRYSGIVTRCVGVSGVGIVLLVEKWMGCVIKPKLRT